MAGVFSTRLSFSGRRSYRRKIRMYCSPSGTALRLRRNVKQAALVGAGMLLVSSVRAQDPTWLDWNVPPECPPKSVIEARVAEWLGGPLKDPEQLAVQAELSWQELSWHVTVDVTYQGHHGQRQVIVSSCQDAADFVALAVVLTVDPALAPQFPEADAALQSPVVSEEQVANEAPTQNPPETPPVVQSEQEVKVSARPRRRQTVRGHVTLEAEGTYGPLPGVRPGAALGLGIDLERHVLMLNARWLPGMNVEPAQAAAPISFGLLAGRLAWAYLFGGGDLSGGPLVSVSVGAISTKQSPDQAHRQFWAAVGVGGTGLYQIRPWVKLVGELEFEVPWVRPTFVLSDGSTIHQVSLGARGALGARFFFPVK